MMSISAAMHCCFASYYIHNISHPSKKRVPIFTRNIGTTRYLKLIQMGISILINGCITIRWG